MAGMDEYLIKTSSRRSSIAIHVSATGQVIVTKPKHVPDFIVKRFVLKQQGWIAAQKLKQARKKQLFTPSTVWLFGQEYARVVSHDPQLLPGAYYLIDHAAVYVPASKLSSEPLTSAKLDQALNRFVKAAAKHFMLPRIEFWTQAMQVTHQRVTFKEQSSRWGSCSSQGNLNFNWRLAHFSPPVIEYVIIHELAHLTQMNHSPKFWRLVAQFDPQYKLHQKELQRAALSIE